MGAQAVRLSNVDIDNALKNKDFEVLFQPIFDLGNGALARMETFVRWRHASLGLLPPGAFISFFESQGRMSELTRYVLTAALQEYRDWRGPSAPGFSINLALSDLSDEGFVAHFEVMLRDCGFPPELITLECPMPPVDQPLDASIALFDRIADTGARLAIEVRGRANDFLRNADPFPFDEIKTGGAAILRFARTVRGPGLSAISELLDIAQKTNAAITAVGVEDQASLAALRGMGFAAAQGNHLGKVGDLKSFTPGRVNEVRALLGLDPLAAADLQALFRTNAPALQKTTEVQPAEKPPLKAEGKDDLVERLAARIAQQDETDRSEPAEAAPRGAPVGAPPSGLDPARAAARAAKAAAIARAKKRAREAVAGEAAEPAARQLQERLTRAFGPSDAARDEFDIGDLASDSVSSTSSEQATGMAEKGPDEIDLPAAEPLRAAGDGAPLVSASLAVGATRAYFRPGMRIGVIGPSQPPPRLREGPRPQSAPPAPPASEPAPPSDAEDAASRPSVSAEKGQARAAALAEPQIPFVEPAALSGEPAPEALAPAPVAEDAAPASPEQAVRRELRAGRRAKGFLERTVIPYPTHFWPASWRRAWRRRRAAIAARDADAAE